LRPAWVVGAITLPLALLPPVRETGRAVLRAA
jgi:hypothetical protein